LKADYMFILLTRYVKWENKASQKVKSM